MESRSAIELRRVATSLQVDASHPAVAYVASLAASSRPTMARQLRNAAGFFGHTIASCPWTQLELSHVLALRSWAGEKYAPGTANGCLVAVRMVHRFAVRLGQMTDHAARLAWDGVRPVRGERVAKGRHVEAVEVGRVFEALEAGGGRACPARRSRDAAMFALLYGGGLRRDEAASLDLSDVRIDEGAVYVRRGKGRKQRVVPLCDDAMAAIQDWIENARGKEPGPLLLPTRGRVPTMERFTGSGIYRAVLAAGKRAGVARFAPHDCRRTYVGDLFDAGADIGVIAGLAGHTNVTTTARYDRRPERARRKAAALIRLPYRRRTEPAGALPRSVEPSAHPAAGDTSDT